MSYININDMKKFKKNLPTYEFLIDDSELTGVDVVSIVADPAHGSSAVFFAKDSSKFITFSDVKKQIVAGLALIPDVKIYRVDAESGEEYYGFFSAETIEKIVDRFHDQQRGKNVNLEHDSNSTVDAYLKEDYIVNSEARVADLKALGIEHPNIMGAWYTAYKIKDKEQFEQIVAGGSKVGFSVEAYLDTELSKFNEQIKNKFIKEKIEKEMKKVKKTFKQKLMSLFAEIDAERALVPELAFDIEWGEIGEVVNKIVIDEAGNEILEPAGKGEFTTEYGIIVTDEASMLVEIREVIEEPEIEVPVEEPVSGDTAFAVSGDTVVTGDTGMTTGATFTVRGIDAPVNSLVDLSKDGEYVINLVVAGGQIKDAIRTSQVSLMSRQAFGDMEKRLKELIPSNKAGEYTISVSVDADGNYVYGSVSAWTQLKFHSEEEIKKLNDKINEYKLKLKEPITDPMLEPEVIEVDYTKMSAYEKLMHKKGLTAFKK